MAIQTRYTGDAQGIVNVDGGVGTVGNIIATGLTKNPVVFKVINANLTTASELVTGGAVETILRAIEVDSTVTMYQLDSNGNLSVMVEATGAGGSSGSSSQLGAAAVTTATIATALQTRLQALNAGGNIGVSANVWAALTTVATSNFKLA